MYHKTHGMVTRYKNQDIEDVADTQDSTTLDLMPQDHSVLEGDNDLSEEYCKETDTHHPLVDLLEQFQQLKNQYVSLKSNTPQSTSTEELLLLTDKLKHLTMVLQPASQSSEYPVHNTMQAYTDTLHATQRESNLTTTMLHDILTFDGQDSLKLKDWFIDIKTTTDFLTESHTCLVEAKSCSLSHKLICKAAHTAKCWD